MHLRKRKIKSPCLGCYLHHARCICHQFPLLTLKTKISLVVHAKELKRASNTGRLAVKALVNSEMRVRGLERTTLDLSDLLSPDYRSFLFYPSEEAQELNQDILQGSPLPIQLIVPDGNWRQASRVHYRHPELKNIPRIKISTPNTATLHMRSENTEYGMATLQAIAMALGIIEGPEVQRELLKLYQAKLEQTLLGRGKFF